jgi:FkbM family methyltransferase
MGEMQKLVSVIIPTHNRPKCVKRAVESVLNQTYKNVEIIIIDDIGNARDIVTEISGSIKGNIRYRQIPQTPYIAESRNAGIKDATGDYIAFLDDDDYWLPEKLQTQVEIFQRNPNIGLVCGNVYTVDSEKETPQLLYFPQFTQIMKGKLFFQMLTDCFCPTSTILMKRPVLEVVGGYTVSDGLRDSEEVEFVCRCALITECYFDPRPHAVYLNHGLSTTRTYPSNTALSQTFERREYFLSTRKYQMRSVGQFAKEHHVRLSPIEWYFLYCYMPFLMDIELAQVYFTSSQRVRGLAHILKTLMRNPKYISSIPLDLYFTIRKKFQFQRGIAMGDILTRSKHLAKRSRQFFDYNTRSDIEIQFTKLMKNLDRESIQVLQTVYSKFLFIAANFYIPKDIFYDTDYEMVSAQRMKEIQKRYQGISIPSYINLKTEVDYFNSGLSFVPKEVLQEKEGTDIIDCGAYDGDSAWVFERFYHPSRIFAFEPVRANYSRLLETISCMALKKVIPVNKGPSYKKSIEWMACDGGSSHVRSSGWFLGKKQVIEMVDLDSFVSENNANPGIIKMDIEGSEYNAIAGAMNTIRTFRPILLIAIYHTPKDFFEIKPLLENELSDYTFLVRKLATDFSYELMLICYPEPVNILMSNHDGRMRGEP